MYKKIIIILSAIIVLSLPFQQHYAESAIFSKVASTGAKKVVKEIIKESAFDTAINLFVDEAYKMAAADQAKYQAQADYELFCGKKMPDLIECERPMQVKKVLTSADKINIGNQAELELDKLITGGKGFTRWQKFLDWFIPIWVASFALTAITYAIDPEVRSLFNEAGYNALVALGIIKPVIGTTEVQPFETVQLPPTPQTDTTSPDVISRQFPNNNALTSANFYDFSAISAKDIIVKADHTGGQTDINGVSIGWQLGGDLANIELDTTISRIAVSLKMLGNVGTAKRDVTIALNGTSVQTIPYSSASGYFTYNGIKPEINTILKKTKSVQTRTPYEINGMYYTDVLYNTVDGNVITFQFQTVNAPSLNYGSMSRIQSITKEVSLPTNAERITIFRNQPAKKVVLTPVPYEQVENGIDLIDNSKYEQDGKVALIPSSALPYTQTSTGIQLTPEIDVNGEPKFTTPSGESIPEDDITVGEPSIQENPSPAPNTVTPPATSTNPNPQPIPLTPSVPLLPPPAIETLPPVFPEGESCDVGLKLPKISPLAYAVSESFPFSIPFDLYDGFQAIFSEMGNEKPEFTYKLNFMGEQQEWKISIPDYFDSWKRFTDSFLIFVFDVGIIFMIFRFMGGSK